jgi:hypothetical protein
MTAIRGKLEQVKSAGYPADDSQGDYSDALNSATRDQVKELVELVEMLIDRLDNSPCT